MGLFFKSKKKEGKNVAIFDIGSSSVGGAYVYIPNNNEEKVPVVIESLRLEMKEVKDNNIFDLEKEATTTLKKTAEALFQRKIGKLDEVVCVITTPWSHSETKRISVSNHVKINVTKKMLNDLINKEIEIITKNLRERENNNKEVVESLITEISIDDRVTDNPIGKSCKFLDLSFSYSYVNESFIKKSKKALSDVFTSAQISFSSFSLLTYLMIRDNYFGQESHLILDISGETTDLSVINNGIFGEKYSFPFGKKTILRSLALNLKIEYRDACELFKLYYQNNLSLSHREKLKKYFESTEKLWSEELKRCLYNIPSFKYLPRDIFLTIDTDIRNWFFEIFKKTEFSNNVTFGKKFNITILDENELIDKCELTKGSNDPFIMIEAIALSRK